MTDFKSDAAAELERAIKRAKLERNLSWAVLGLLIAAALIVPWFL